MQVLQDMERNLFEPQLQTRGQIAIAISQWCLRIARPAKRGRVFVRENSANHGRTFVPNHFNAFSVVTKVIEVQPKVAVLFSANDLAKLFDEPWPAVWRQAHDF